jgi:hypothetical protein
LPARQSDDAGVARLEAKARRLLQRGRPTAALRYARRAVARHARVVPSAALVSTLVLVADCCAAAAKPVTAVRSHAEAVLLLDRFQRDAESDPVRSDPVAGHVFAVLEAAVYGRRIDAVGLDEELRRLSGRLHPVVIPFRTEESAARARLAGLRRDELAALPDMMIKVCEVALACFQGGRRDAALTFSRAVVVLGQASQHLGDAYRRPLIRALFDVAGHYQDAGRYGEMWQWVRPAIVVAAARLDEPGRADLLVMSDALKVASQGLASAALLAQALRAQQVAQQIRHLSRGLDPVAVAAIMRVRVADLLHDVDARLQQ